MSDEEEFGITAATIKKGSEARKEEAAFTPAADEGPAAANANPLQGQTPMPGGGKKLVKVQKIHNKNGGSKAYVGKPSHEHLTEEEFEEKVSCLFHSDTYSFSGCQDAQTSADVYDVTTFGLPKIDASKPEAGGGACTNALISIAQKNPGISFGDLLIEMRSLLKDKGYSQIPQLSCSHQIDLKNEKFTLTNPKSNGNMKALLIGINYTGQDGSLNGCVNDQKTIHRWLGENGFPINNKEKVQYLTDDKEWTCAEPNGKNIVAAMQWLVKDAKEGDTLFLSYSGHGVQLPDRATDGDIEEDGYDEAIAPLDWESNGFIRDENIFSTVVGPIGKGVRLVSIFDCCNSGTMMELPVEFIADEENVADYLAGRVSKLMANALFSFEDAGNMIADVANGVWDGISDLARTMRRKMCTCCC